VEVLCLFIPHLPVQWEFKKGVSEEGAGADLLPGVLEGPTTHRNPPESPFVKEGAGSKRGAGDTPAGDLGVSPKLLNLPPRVGAKGLKAIPDPLLIIGGFPHERKTVLDCSEAAVASGVHPGMALRQASHRCPDAIFLPVDEPGYGTAFEEVLDILAQFSPIMETDCLGKAFLDVTGTEQLFGPAENLAEQASRDVLRQTGFKYQIGVASSKFVASIAASLASTSPLIVRSGEEKKFLDALSVELLPISQEAITWLKRLGLRHMGQVASLPENALAGQLGGEGLKAHRLANGLDGGEPVRPRPRPDMLEQTLSFEDPLESLDALLAGLDKLLDQLVPLLRRRYQVCGQIRLCFRSEDGRSCPDTVILKTPLDSKPEILGILKRHLETASFPEGVSEVSLGLARLGSEFGKQAPLSSGSKGRQEEALQRLEKDLGHRFGHSSLKKVVAIDPDSRIPERRVALVDANTDV
jgi:nucleotidyltransferase/DNA polymerase involved in DNA repair